MAEEIKNNIENEENNAPIEDTECGKKPGILDTVKANIKPIAIVGGTAIVFFGLGFITRDGMDIHERAEQAKDIVVDALTDDTVIEAVTE